MNNLATVIITASVRCIGRWVYLTYDLKKFDFFLMSTQTRSKCTSRDR